MTEFAAMTNFTRVTQFMKLMGQDVPDSILRKPSETLKNFRLKLIEEEVSELKEALSASDTVEIMDALGDILYVVYGAGAALGIDLDNIFGLIHKSNMSKICNTEEEVQKTIQWYENHPEKGYPNPVAEPRDGDSEETLWVVKCGDTGKILKSVNYKPVTQELSDVLDNQILDAV